MHGDFGPCCLSLATEIAHHEVVVMLTKGPQ